MKKLLALLVISGLLGFTTGCPDTAKDKDKKPGATTPKPPDKKPDDKKPDDKKPDDKKPDDKKPDDKKKDK